MGLGRDMARQADPSAPHHDVLENFRDQLVIAFLKRLAGKAGTFEIPVAEVDATGSSVVTFAVQDRPERKAFVFEVTAKQ